MNGRPAGVLVCDDNASMRILLGAVVESAASRLQGVGNAADGTVAVGEAERLQPDVILLDLAMPNRSGMEALPDLRRVAPEARIVVLSGFAATAVAEQVLTLGATSYLEKGAHPDEIVAAIDRAVASPHSATVAPAAAHGR